MLSQCSQLPSTQSYRLEASNLSNYSLHFFLHSNAIMNAIQCKYNQYKVLYMANLSRDKTFTVFAVDYIGNHKVFLQSFCLKRPHNVAKCLKVNKKACEESPGYRRIIK